MKASPLVVAGILLGLMGNASGRCGDDVETGFTLFARDQIVIGAGSVVSGGAVGVADLASEPRAGDDGFAVEITGAKVRGDVYGPSVLLGSNARVGRIFTDELQVDGRARHGRVTAFPVDLPRIAAVPRIDFADTFAPLPFFVLPGTRAELGPRATAVTVASGATLVLTGGRYEIGSLEVASGGRLEVVRPSLLMVDRIVDFGARAYVGPARRTARLNLTILVGANDLVGSSDGFTGGAVVVGKEAAIAAILRVNGTISMNSGSTVRGVVYAHRILLDNATVNRLTASEVPPEISPQCSLPGGCVGPGACPPVKLPPGTPCNDGNACTAGDACDDAGQCLAGVTLPDPDPFDTKPCVRDECDPDFGPYEPAGTVCDSPVACHADTTCNGLGACSAFGAPHPEGTPCDDAIPNNGPDTCHSSGGCYGLLGAFDCKANTCSAQPGDPPDLACWFASHPAIRDSIGWRNLDVQNPTVIPFTQWSATQKQQLADAFVAAWQWFDNGLTSFPGVPFPEPPPNDLVQSDSDPAGTMFMEATAFPLYLAHVAHSLAVEIRGEVSWSLCDLSPQLMVALLSGSHPAAHYVDGFVPGHFPAGYVTPAHPTFTFQFLVQNGLIGASRLQTIGNVVDWSRRLSHFGGAPDAANMEQHWQYRGFAPVSRTIEGTLHLQYPSIPISHWTMGCTGTTGFLQGVLRAVNIPVQVGAACQHQVPHFLSEGMYLSHGDDPYDAYFREGPNTTVYPPGEDFLIDEAQFMAWFTGPAASCSNVGRRVADLAVDLLPDSMVGMHCLDLLQGTSHADSKVYEGLGAYFTVQELEALTLWSRLDQRVLAEGLSCGGP